MPHQDVTLRREIDAETVRQISWDTAFNEELIADWIIAEPEAEPDNAGGFRSLDPLGTAVIQCLFTDRRRPSGVTSSDPSDTDPRGWHGDGFDLDEESSETELGSLLWTIADRGYLGPDTARLAEQYMREALQVLIDQGAASDIKIVTVVDKANGWLIGHVQLFDETNEELFSGAVPVVTGLATFGRAL